MKKIFENSWIVCLIAIFCNILWGSAFPSVKMGYIYFAIHAEDTAAQILFAGCRFFFAGLFVILFCSVVQKKVALPKKADLFGITVTGCVQTVLQYCFFYIGLAHTSGAKSSILTATNVFFGILIACLLVKSEVLTYQKIIGCLIGFFGVVLINLSNKEVTPSWTNIGDIAILLSSISNAMAAVLIKKFSQKTNPALLNGYQFLFGGTVMIIGASIFGGRFPSICLPGIAVLAYLSFLSACAYTLWSILLRYNPVTKVTIYGFTNPIFGVLLSVYILKENTAFGIRCVLSLIFVCAGIIIVNSTRVMKRK